METIDFATEFATRAHEGQVRKGGDIPYIRHPARVSRYLAGLFPDRENLIVAGVLHDVVEDTDVGIEAIDALFGRPVGDLVYGVTRYDATWRLDPKGNPDVLRLKAADLDDNIRDTAHDIEAGRYVWDRFAAGRHKIVSWKRLAVIIREGLLTNRDHDRGDLPGDGELVFHLEATLAKTDGLASIVTDEERALRPSWQRPGWTAPAYGGHALSALGVTAGDEVIVGDPEWAQAEQDRAAAGLPAVVSARHAEAEAGA